MPATFITCSSCGKDVAFHVNESPPPRPRRRVKTWVALALVVAGIVAYVRHDPVLAAGKAEAARLRALCRYEQAASVVRENGGRDLDWLEEELASLRRKIEERDARFRAATDLALAEVAARGERARDEVIEGLRALRDRDPEFRAAPHLADALRALERTLASAPRSP